jgi:TPR repeat protein
LTKRLANIVRWQGRGGKIPTYPDPAAAVRLSKDKGMQGRKALAILSAAIVVVLHGLSCADAQPRGAGGGRDTASLLAAAQRGDVRAQSRIAFMYETGRGLPQDYYLAATWYLSAAERGYAPAQHRLGLLFDKGLGVPENYVEAYKWLNLAAGAAPLAQREHFLRVRDAVAQKMTLPQLERGQWLSSHWRPR